MADQTPRDEAQALYEQMTVVDLQADLGERNLTKTGTKPELVARLLDADFPQAPAADPASPKPGSFYSQTSDEDLKKELTERGLSTDGDKPDLVERLLANDAEEKAAKGVLSINEARAELDLAPIEPPADEPAVEDGDLCGNCWPAGWPTPDTAAASCEHGVWDR